MVKVKGVNLIEQAKKRKVTDEKKNFTFRFRKGLVESFKKICEREGLSMTDLLEEFMESTVNQTNK